MTEKEKIEKALAVSGKTAADLARELKTTRQAIFQRMKTGKFSLEEWEKIAQFVGADFKAYFEFPNGRRV